MMMTPQIPIPPPKRKDATKKMPGITPGGISPRIRRQNSRLTKSLLIACAITLGVAGCRDQATHTKITRCADGLEVAVFYDKDSGFPPPAKVEFRKGGKVVTLSWEEEYLLEDVVSPDQK